MKKLTPIKKLINSPLTVLAIILVIFVAYLVITVGVSPFRAFGGAVWVKNGIHYITDEQISDRIQQINAPKETEIAKKIQNSTSSCDKVDGGYCQKSPEEYVYKTLDTPAVEYEPGTPDTEEIIGYCTLCNDGTYSSSCAVGRGACSWHGGVASYGVAQYRIIPGTPEVQAQPAVYSYETKSYQNSPIYEKPGTPTIWEIVGY